MGGMVGESLRWLHLHKISLFFLTWWWNDFSVNQITHSSKSLITLHVTKKIMVSIHQSVREGGSKNKWAVVCTLPSFRHSKAPKLCIPMRESGTCIMCRCDWLFTCLLCTNLSSIYILNTILQSKLPAFNIGALAVTVILSLCSSCKGIRGWCNFALNSFLNLVSTKLSGHAFFRLQKENSKCLFRWIALGMIELNLVGKKWRNFSTNPKRLGQTCDCPRGRAKESELEAVFG